MSTRNLSKRSRDEVLKKLVQKFGEGFIETGIPNQKLEAWPTGSDDLDEVLTKGAMGFAKGAIVELIGGEAAGKSSVALRTVGLAQKEGHQCVWFDAEASFSNDLAIINGVKPEELLMPSMATATEKADDGAFFNSSEVLNMIYMAVVSNAFGIIVLDSVAGLLPDMAIKDPDPNKQKPGEVANSMSRHLGKIAQACKATATTVIFINQLRDKIGAYNKHSMAARFHSPGGRALKFFAHQRVGLIQKGGDAGKIWAPDEDGSSILIGHYARASVIKNRMAPPVPPDVNIEIPIYYRHYDPDNAKKCYDTARLLKVITIRNGILSWKDDNRNIILQVEGEGSMLKLIRDNSLESRLASVCVAAAAEGKKSKNPVKIPKSVQDLAGTYVDTGEKISIKGDVSQSNETEDSEHNDDL